ncbi:uncharacterized protein LOC108087455 [Drosophila ficusphila]|uniref:uncharacterized protein LOC108087455 n=1 Tax=Drosophila ficusphila TaxID=30025 RepID=UPI0007E696B9|nr:uncharacterized protein LOC108087455 [Drosophila ficusphila]
MSSSETDRFTEEEVEPLIASVPVPMSPNLNLQDRQAVEFSPSLSVTSVDGSQATESTASFPDLQEVSPSSEHYLRSVRATTNLRPSSGRRRSVSSLQSSSSSATHLRRRNEISQLLYYMQTHAPLNGYLSRRFRRLRTMALAERRRLPAGSIFDLNDFGDLEMRDPKEQALRRGNSVSDCSQCSSDEEEVKGKGKVQKPTVPPQLAEWLYPV